MQKITFTLYLLCLFLFTAVISCKESPTVVNGKVVDKVTGEPIEHASLYISSWNQNEREWQYFTVLFSDNQGMFSFGDEENPKLTLDLVRKNGYLYKQNTIPAFEENKINTAIIPLIPIDGAINLKVENVSGIHDSIYLLVYSPLLHAEIGISEGITELQKNPVVLAMGESFEQIVSLASDETVTVYWSTSPFSKPALGLSQANIEIVRFDTLNHTITY